MDTPDLSPPTEAGPPDRRFFRLPRSWGGWLGLYSLFCLVIYLLGAALRPKDTAQGPPSLPVNQAQASQKEQEKVRAALEVILNQDKQGVFDAIHPLGTAKSLSVHEVEPFHSDTVHGYRARCTLYWSTLLTDDGYTKFSFIYDRETNRTVSLNVIATNGVQKQEVESAMGQIAGFVGAALLQDAFSSN